MFYGRNSSDSAIKYFKRLGIYKASNVVFDPKDLTAYSYNHWCFVRKVNGLVIFNDYNYSMSTCGHQSKVRSVLNDLKIKIDVTVSIRESLGSNCLDVALASCYHDLFTAETAINRKGARPKSRRFKYDLSAAKNATKEIAKLIKVGAKCSKAKQAEIKTNVLKIESDRLAEMRTKRLSKATGKPLISNDAFVKKSNSFEIV